MIVIGYTPDQYGAAALEHGIAEGQVRKTPVLVINTTKGDALADPHFAQEAEMAHVHEQLTASGVEFDVRQPLGTDAVETLLDAVEETDAELLVIGIRHRTPVGKLLMGSTAQQLLLACPKPILAVKPLR